MTLELILIVTAVEGGSSKNKNRPITKEYIKIKVNGNNYDHIREQMDEFVTDFQKANTHRHYSSVQWTWEKAGEDKEELGGGIE
jgi:flagellar motor component MotA